MYLLRKGLVPMPSLAVPGPAKAHPLEQMDDNMFGPLPRRDHQTKLLGEKKKTQQQTHLESSNPL